MLSLEILFFFFCPLFSLRFSRELLLIKILTRGSYIVYIVETGGAVNAGFNKTPAATAHIADNSGILNSAWQFLYIIFPCSRRIT